MTRVLALTAITVLLGAPAATELAQGTDFSGTWNLDRDSSELPQGRGGGGGGGGGRGGGGRGGRGGLMADTLVISQTATSITVEQQAGEDHRGEATPFIDLLVETRNQLRAERNWKLGDSIRSQLEELGVTLEDTASGTQWRFKNPH